MLPESTIHSFVIKIWLEETASKTDDAVWRGHITHIPDGERRYFQSLDEIGLVIAPYLEEVGVKFPLWWRLRRWVRRGVAGRL